VLLLLLLEASSTNDNHATTTLLAINNQTYEMIEFTTLLDFLHARQCTRGKQLVKRVAVPPSAFDLLHGSGNWVISLLLCCGVNESAISIVYDNDSH
jgi:hypothetical protein